MVGFLFKILLKMDQTLLVESDTCYTHNFSFRCDIICPVSFAIFLCFSLPLHGIAMPHNCRTLIAGRNSFVAGQQMRDISVHISQR